MNHPRRVRSPPFGYDPRVMGRPDPRPPPDYDDPYTPATPFEPTQSAPAFVEPHPHPYPIGYREHRLPSTYRATLREQYNPGPGSAPYKILCITNINHKVSDGPVKEALTNDFSRFGDISVSICHDSGERLAYIYFRTYEEAREARHSKARTLLFDRPIEIEPIYEPRSPPTDSPPQSQLQQQQPPPQPPQGYSRRRSITPPDYYGVNGPLPPQQQLPPSQARRPHPPPPPPPNPHHRGLSPPPSYSHNSRYPPGPPPPMPPAQMPYGRYYLPPSHLPPSSPYHSSSPPHEQYRSYHSHPNQFQSSGHSYHQSSYGPPPPIGRSERDRTIINDSHLASRSPRGHEAYYPMDHHRGYPPPSSAQHSSRSLHSSSSHHQPNLSPNVHHQSSNRRSPPHHPDYPRYGNRDFIRRDKFSSENFNNEPEGGRPSRVLFVTNIDPTKTEADLKDIFESFGVIEEAELKKIRDTDFSSALIKFSSMDCAYKAKTATNGKYFGSMKCRITYGKISASRRLWIGGLGPATTVAYLDDEFGKYGNITSLDYISGRPYAYIEYESANQAQFAAHHLRGTLVAEAERKLRIEYVDSDRGNKVSKHDSSLQVSDNSSSRLRPNESWDTTNDHEPSPQLNSRKRSITPTDINTKRVPQAPVDISTTNISKCESEHRSNAVAAAPAIAKVSATSSPINDKSNDKNEMNNNQEAGRKGGEKNGSVNSESQTDNLDSTSLDALVQSKSIRDIIDCCSISWFGQLVLRNFNFPSTMFMCSGRKTTIEKYITKLNGENGDQCPILRITQRWRLHPQPKLEEVKRRMQSGNLGMLIITSRTTDQSPILSSPTCKTPQSSTSQTAPKQNGDNEAPASVDEKTTETGSESSITQSRPLKNLISYLEQKDAAGVISLNALDRDQTDGSKLLYAFPPGDFALNLLKRKAPNLSPESTKEEFLLGVIVGSTEAKI